MYLRSLMVQACRRQQVYHREPPQDYHDSQYAASESPSTQGHRKVDEAVKILLTANSGEERLAMKSGFFESAPVGS